MENQPSGPGGRGPPAVEYTDINRLGQLFLRQEDPVNATFAQPSTLANGYSVPAVGGFRGIGSEHETWADSAYGTHSGRERRVNGPHSAYGGTEASASNATRLGIGGMHIGSPYAQSDVGGDAMRLQFRPNWVPAPFSASTAEQAPANIEGPGSITYNQSVSGQAAGIDDEVTRNSILTEDGYQCNHCMVMKKPKCEMLKHIRTHTKPFKCKHTDCKRSFATQSDLKRHKDTKHTDSKNLQQPYVCEIGNCSQKDKLWARWDNLKTHLRDVHKLLQPDREMFRVRNIGSQNRDLAGLGFSHALDSSISQFASSPRADMGDIGTEFLDEPNAQQGLNELQSIMSGVKSPAEYDALAFQEIDRLSRTVRNGYVPTDTQDDRQLDGLMEFLIQPGSESAADQGAPYPASPDSPTNFFNDAESVSVLDTTHRVVSNFDPAAAIPETPENEATLFRQSLPYPPAPPFSTTYGHHSATEDYNLAIDTYVPSGADPSDAPASAALGDNAKVATRDKHVSFGETDVHEERVEIYEDYDISNEEGIFDKTSNVHEDDDDDIDLELETSKEPQNYSSGASVERTETSIPSAKSTIDVLSLSKEAIRDILATLEKDKRLSEFGYCSINNFTSTGTPTQTRSAKSVQSNQSESAERQHTCNHPGCTAAFTSNSALVKHSIRHKRPFACTFGCTVFNSPDARTFGSKNDWRRHEESVHFVNSYPGIEWRCRETLTTAATKTTCQGLFDSRDAFQSHLANVHDTDDKKRVAEKEAKARHVLSTDACFWCGFCKRTIQVADDMHLGLAGGTYNAEAESPRGDAISFQAFINERFRHIDNHFIGRGPYKQQSINGWTSEFQDQSGQPNKTQPLPNHDSYEVGIKTSRKHVLDESPPGLSKKGRPQPKKPASKKVIRWYCCICLVSHAPGSISCIACEHKKCVNCEQEEA